MPGLVVPGTEQGHVPGRLWVAGPSQGLPAVWGTGGREHRYRVGTAVGRQSTGYRLKSTGTMQGWSSHILGIGSTCCHLQPGVGVP